MRFRRNVRRNLEMNRETCRITSLEYIFRLFYMVRRTV